MHLRLLTHSPGNRRSRRHTPPGLAARSSVLVAPRSRTRPVARSVDVLAVLGNRWAPLPSGWSSELDGRERSIGWVRSAITRLWPDGARSRARVAIAVEGHATIPWEATQRRVRARCAQFQPVRGRPRRGPRRGLSLTTSSEIARGVWLSSGALIAGGRCRAEAGKRRPLRSTGSATSSVSGGFSMRRRSQIQRVHRVRAWASGARAWQTARATDEAFRPASGRRPANLPSLRRISRRPCAHRRRCMRRSPTGARLTPASARNLSRRAGEQERLQQDNARLRAEIERAR